VARLKSISRTRHQAAALRDVNERSTRGGGLLYGGTAGKFSQTIIEMTAMEVAHR
jgi:hypothetical protein